MSYEEVYKTKGKKEKHVVFRAVMVHEVQALFDAVRKDNSMWKNESHRLFFLLANFGLRIGEALALQYKAFRDLDHSVLLVPTFKREGHPEEPLFIGNLEKKWINKVFPEIRGTKPDRKVFGMSVRKAQYLFAYYCKQAKLRKEIVLHSLRHFAAVSVRDYTNMREMGLARLRHKPKDMLDFYLTASPERQIQLLNNKLPIV